MKNIIIFLLLTSNVYADEFRFGSGFNFGTPIGDGIWKQQHLDNEYQNYGLSVSGQYIGNTNIDWLDYSVGFGYRKGATAKGEYITDDCYNKQQYSGGTLINIGGVMVADCDRRYFAKDVSTNVYSMMLTLNPTWRVNKDLSFSSAIGVSIFSATLKMEWDSTKGVCALTYCEEATFRNREIAPYFEGTVKYQSFYLTVYLAWNENAPETPTFNNYGVIAGYSHRF